MSPVSGEVIGQIRWQGLGRHEQVDPAERSVGDVFSHWLTPSDLPILGPVVFVVDPHRILDDDGVPPEPHLNVGESDPTVLLQRDTLPLRQTDGSVLGETDLGWTAGCRSGVTGLLVVGRLLVGSGLLRGRVRRGRRLLRRVVRCRRLLGWVVLLRLLWRVVFPSLAHCVRV